MKMPYTSGGNLNCLAKVTPNRKDLFDGKLDQDDFGRYQASDWKAALRKSSRQRAAENFVAAQRLAAHGLGPKPMGIVAIKNVSVGFTSERAEAVGILMENVYDLPKKNDALEEEILAAGVVLDRIRSCLRQQINGYVSDLNSVVRVMPFNAEDEVAEIRDFIDLQLQSSNCNV